MNEVAARIEAKDAVLEGMYSSNPAGGGALICHPHPQYGGTMHNNVVKAAVKAFIELGFSTLRFNFRGVENSTGTYGQGITEREDVKAAYYFLREEGLDSIIVGGYSFGSWVVAQTLSELPAAGLLLISPPITMADIRFENISSPFWIICGEHDAFCPQDSLKQRLDGASHLRGIRWVKGTDHFYFGHEDAIKSAIKVWYESFGDK